jgi:hypothetical protein
VDESVDPREGSGADLRRARIDEVARQARARFEADAPQAMTDEDSARLEMVVRGVGDVRFPATTAELVDVARARDEELAVELRSLPDGARYGTVDELLLALGVGTAGRIDVPGAPPRRPDAGPPIDA